VHRVFAIVHNHLFVLQQTSDMRLAIARIARNVVRRHLRRMEAQLGVDPAPERGGPGPFDQLPSEALAQKSTAELVDLILSQMSGPEREVFVLVEVEGFSATEAAQVLRLDERTLDERLEEARKVFNVMSAQLRAQQFWISRAGVETR
jgi:DNA-directed RNA polymerase specialized sigma24 family protein